MQDNTKQTQHKGIRPWRDGLLVGVTTFFVTFACSSMMYYYASKGLLNEVQETLFHVARTAAVMTDGELHQTLTDNAQKGSENYLRVQKPYREIVSVNPSIAYIYTVIEKNNKAYFIIDTQQPAGKENIPEKDRKSTANIMEEYAEIPATMMTALHDRKPLAEDAVYSDKWGQFISAYVPIYNSKKEYIGIVGADIDATDFIARMNAIRIPYAIGLVFALAFSVVLTLVIYFIRAGHLTRSTARKKQLEALREFHQHIAGVTRAVSDISFKIDGKTAQISGMAQTSTEKTIFAQRVIQGSSDKMQGISDSVARLLQVVQGLSDVVNNQAASLKQRITQVISSADYSERINGAMRNISSVVKIIDDITERIDLLALNAAIEAARAGDAGKGFMVVANEIKTLSAQAGSSADTISKHIKEMDAMVKAAVSNMGNTDGLTSQIDMITQETQDVISEQQAIVGYINEDIKSVMQSSAEIISMVNIIAEVSADTSAKTMHMHKDVHLLYEQNSSLNAEVEKFVKQL